MIGSQITHGTDDKKITCRTDCICNNQTTNWWWAQKQQRNNKLTYNKRDGRYTDNKVSTQSKRWKDSTQRTHETDGIRDNTIDGTQDITWELKAQRQYRSVGIRTTLWTDDTQTTCRKDSIKRSSKNLLTEWSAHRQNMNSCNTDHGKTQLTDYFWDGYHTYNTVLSVERQNIGQTAHK